MAQVLLLQLLKLQVPGPPAAAWWFQVETWHHPGSVCPPGASQQMIVLLLGPSWVRALAFVIGTGASAQGPGCLACGAAAATTSAAASLLQAARGGPPWPHTSTRTSTSSSCCALLTQPPDAGPMKAADSQGRALQAGKTGGRIRGSGATGTIPAGCRDVCSGHGSLGVEHPHAQRGHDIICKPGGVGQQVRADGAGGIQEVKVGCRGSEVHMSGSGSKSVG